MSRTVRVRALLQALVALLLAVGCGAEDPASPPTWPEGTVVVLDGVPILGSEVDAHLDAVRAIRPAASTEELRRLVLMNEALPRARGAAEGGARRAEAREEARAWLEDLRAGERSFDAVTPRTGNWDRIGFELWLAVRLGQPGETLGPFELPGRFAVALLEARSEAPRPELEAFLVRVVEFPFVTGPEALSSRATEGVLDIVDPAWDEIVPGIYKY